MNRVQTTISYLLTEHVSTTALLSVAGHIITLVKMKAVFVLMVHYFVLPELGFRLNGTSQSRLIIFFHPLNLH